MRKTRNALPASDVTQFSTAICKMLLRLDTYHNAQHIACYLAIKNEIDLTLFIEQAWRDNKKIYVPIINRDAGTMDFVRYTPDAPLKINCFDIPEPSPQQPIALAELDLLILPLIAFDAHCNRLGQGGGYYDKYLECYAHLKKRPATIGVAYEKQKIPAVPLEAWDVPLDQIISETTTYKP